MNTNSKSTRFILPIVFGLQILAAAADAKMIHDPRALAANPESAASQIAPVLEGLGGYERPVTTNAESSQLFFNQGLNLTYGFNHSEALRSFKEAARLDPNNAMAYWGWALTLGPNLNLPMQADVVEQAYQAIQRAVALKDNVSQKEQDFIDALAARYANDPMAPRQPLDQAYAEAMRGLAEKYPDDLDALTLYAASLMNLSPWNYWTRDGKPRPNTPIILSSLQTVLDANPDHPGALHYHIHAVEAARPEDGVSSADQLNGLVPGIGHMVHMPSHIYMRVGRYADSYDVNARAAEADEGYITQCRAQGLYPLNYYPHNVHFLSWSAIMLGRSEDALVSARKLAAGVPENMEGNTWALYETFVSMPLFVMTRFGKWDTILNEPQPRKDSVFLTGIWHYARGLALTHTGADIPAIRAELSALDDLATRAAQNPGQIGLGENAKLLKIASHVLHGELAASMGAYGTAISHLDRAVRFEDSLIYNEPPDWYYPVRHTLGATLIAADRAVEAEVVYWDDLKKNPDNGFSLFGLMQSLEAQGRSEEAQEIKAKFDNAWASADHALQSSKF